jgi:hypothetical protein
MKLSTKFSSKANKVISELIENEKTNYNSEVQQRAVEYSVFNANNNYQLKAETAKNIPSSKIVKEENMGR